MADPWKPTSVDEVREFRNRIVRGELASYDDDHIMSETVGPALTYLLDVVATMRDHRDAIRILNTYRDTPSHMRGTGHAEADAKLRDAYDRLRALGVEP